MNIHRKDAEDAKENVSFIEKTLCVLRAFAVRAVISEPT